MKKYWLFILVCGILCGCDLEQSTPQADTGVKKAVATVSVQANGLTVEQENIQKRLQMENAPGSIKHLYVLSAYSGEVILYSTVKGKVTSSGKRLTPYTVAALDGQYVGGSHGGFPITFPNSNEKYTSEVLQDDGTYGSSIDYLYWWDIRGVYHQLYVMGGMIVQISDQPMSFGRVTLSVEKSK